jgi:hypothetical protein
MAIIKPNNNTISAITALPASITTGKVLQVVQTTSSTQSSSTSTSDVEIFNAAITPSSSSNKIFIQVALYLGKGNNETYFCKRGSTKIGGVGGTSGTFINNDSFYNIDQPVTSSANSIDALSWNYVDSPSTTSAVTYSIGHVNGTASPEFYINRSSNDTVGCKGTSTLTLMEIAG